MAVGGVFGANGWANTGVGGHCSQRDVDGSIVGIGHPWGA